MPMDRAELEAVARGWVQLWTAPIDRERFFALHHEAFVDHAPAGRAPTREGSFAGLEAFFRALPGAVTTTEQVVVDEAAQTVAVRWRARSGTLVVTGIELITLRDGRVSERWGEWNDEALRAQGS